MSINSPNYETKQLKTEILVRLIKAFDEENFEESVRLIPYDMRPKGAEVPYRCCVYKERAVLRNRTLAGLGLSIEDDTERVSLAEYAKQVLKREKPEENPLTVLHTACKGCVPSRIYVTDLCQGCVARPCVNTCKFDAISVVNGRSVIDPAKCKNCGMCAQVCPYQAIAKIIVPCENACPVGAIEKDDNGLARIDFDKCISCGKCVSACPFGAVHEKSQIIDILKHIKAGKKVIAMMAPAIAGQLPCTAEQLNTAFLKLGFSKAYEVAQGADVTTKTEAAEFEERMEKGEKFMTTSCCAGYNELIAKHIPEIKPFVSDTKTPAYYTAEIVRKEIPDAVTVFISPCVAKRREAMSNDNIDYILSAEELNAWLLAKEIKPEELEPTKFSYASSKEARNYAISMGVATAVKTVLPESVEITPHVINGINKQTVKDLKKFAKNGTCECGNLIEVMCCEGGCIGGNACVNQLKKSYKQVTGYADEAHSLKDSK